MDYPGTDTNSAEYRAVINESERIRNLLEQHSMLLITDGEGIMTYVSDSLCHLSQYSRQELLGQNASILNSHYHTSSFFEYMWATVREGNTWQGRIRNQAKHGSYFWVDMIIAALLDKDGVAIKYVGIRQDITQLVQHEAQLQFQSHILAHINDAVAGVDEQYRVNYWNQGAEKLYQQKESDVMGKPLSEVYTSIWINEQDEQEAFRALDVQGHCRVELIHQLPTGQRMFVEATTQTIQNEAGEQRGLLAVIRDVTQRKQTENALQQTLQELQSRNHELDNYVYKVSHDLRAPLASMKGLIDLMNSESDPTTREQYLHLVEGRVAKLDTTIQSILQHVQLVKQETFYQPVDIEEIIKANYEELKYYADSEKMNISVKVDADTSFYSDAFRMNVVIRNLLSNAIKYADARKPSSNLRFIIRIEEHKATIDVQDNGIGIDEKILANIFDMFYRAGNEVEGSGLGLYIVKQAVEKLGGTISVASQLGEGTTFHLEFPNRVPADQL